MREYDESKAKVTGVIMTLVLHACAILLVSFSGLKYIWPPPQETSFLLDFSEDEEIEIIQHGNQIRGEDVNPDEHVEIVQRSQSPVESVAQNLTPETKQDNFGDVETPAPEPKEEPKLDPRASFPGMAKKDTTLTAPHSAEKASDSFKAGQAKGNTENGATAGKPNAKLKGRTVQGGLAKPKYTCQEGGTVVVSIWVDQYGNVTKAIAGADGTTVTDKALWAAARTAAMETRFNMDGDAPVLQEGTITYIFNLQ